MSTPALIRGLYGLARPRPRTRAAVTSYQSACLRDLIRHAYSKIPYYRQRFEEAGVTPRDLRSVADLRAFPISTRQDLQRLGPREICDPAAKLEALRTVHTSGSSGEPLVVRRSKGEERLLLALRARAVGAFGVGPRARRANIDHLSPEVVLTEGPELFYERMGIMPRLQLDWRAPAAEIIAAIERFQPHLISGPPSILSWVATNLTDDDRRRIPARLVLTGGETLTPEMRRDVEGGFGLPVADIYGTHEVVFIAMQVPGRNEYRVCEESVVVEVLRDGEPVAPGESGEIVVTALQSFTMPFIRYRLGDEVTLGDQLSGVHGPYSTLRSVDGRTLDKFVLPDGTELLGYTLGEVIEASALSVRRFRVTQVRRDAFRVELALYESDEAEVARVGERMRSILGRGVQVDIEAGATLEQTSRKFYPFIPLERLEAWDEGAPR